MKIISFIENEGLSGGLLQEFKTAPGGPDGSISAIDLVFSDYIECFDFDFHISTRLMISNGNHHL